MHTPCSPSVQFATQSEAHKKIMLGTQGVKGREKRKPNQLRSFLAWRVHDLTFEDGETEWRGLYYHLIFSGPSPYHLGRE